MEEKQRNKNVVVIVEVENQGVISLECWLGKADFIDYVT